MNRDADRGSGLADPETSSHFAPHPDRDGNLERFLLEDVSLGPTRTLPTPLSSGTTDGERLWVLGEETADSWTLALVDLRRDAIRRAATISRTGPRPVVDPETGVAYAVADGSIERYDPRTGDDGPLHPTRSIDINQINLERAVGGLTLSADGDRLGFLVDDDGKRCVAAVHLPTGTVDVWHSSASGCTTVQFSPTDPTLLLYAAETSLDDARGSVARAWLAREGLGARPLSAQLPRRHRAYWWTPEGRGLRYVDPDRGVSILDLELGHRRVEWDVRAVTAHATRDGRVFAATISVEDGTALRVREADGSSVDLGPSPSQGWRPQPTFVAGDSALAYTALVDGRPRVAVAPVSAFR